MLKQLYYTLMYPYLHYGLAIWGAVYKTRLNKICTKQNKCIRSIFFAHDREHVNPYYNLLGILKFENIYRLKVLLFTNKLKNDKSNTPVVLLNILTPASEIHPYNTRYAANQNFFKLSVRTNNGVSTLNSPRQKFANLSHQNLNVFHNSSSKSGIKISYSPHKTDHS